METIVITGSTRGIGFGLAVECAKLGHNVVINGRSDTAVDQAVMRLKNMMGQSAKNEILGCPGDVTDFDDVSELWEQAIKHFGYVSIWINNAGVMNSHMNTWKLTADDVKTVVNVNLLGTIYGCQVAIRGMMGLGGGHVYNFEGFGSNGRQFHPHMTPYGTTKSAIRYLTKSLAKETKGSQVKVGTISPGIVVTDLLKEPYQEYPEEWERAKKIFNILGDRVETVTPYLAREILKKNNKSGNSIGWLTVPKVFARFAQASFKKRDLFAN